jgi:hypothetical protein
VPQLRELVKQRGEPETELEAYIFTAEDALRASYLLRWWRSGLKERWEQYEGVSVSDSPASMKDRVPKIVVFDGSTKKTLSKAVEPHDNVAYVGLLEKDSEWFNLNRKTPFSVIWEFQNHPFSELIERSPSVDIRAVDCDGVPATAVEFRHPDFDWRSFILYFDASRRLVRRDVIAKLSPEIVPRIYERATMSEFLAEQDESGETIWFPRRVAYDGFAGVLTDGTPVKNVTDVLEIQEIRFNVNIADDKFSLDFPHGTRIYDDVTGLGWLDEAEKRGKAQEQFVSPRGRIWPMLLLINGIAVAGIVIVMLYKRNHQKHTR